MEWVALILIAALLLVGIVSASNRLPGSDRASTQLRVERGETLWSIASQHPLPGMTTDQTVELLAKLNGDPSGALNAGTVIRIPVQPSNGLAVASR